MMWGWYVCKNNITFKKYHIIDNSKVYNFSVEFVSIRVKRNNLRIVIDLPLIDKDTCVFGNEVPIKRCVF